MENKIKPWNMVKTCRKQLGWDRCKEGLSFILQIYKYYIRKILSG